MNRLLVLVLAASSAFPLMGGMPRATGRGGAWLGGAWLQDSAYTSPNGSFVLEHFTQISFDALGLHAVANGSPFHLQWRDRGVDLNGRTAVVDAAKEDTKDFYYVTSAKIGGGVTILHDTQKAYQFAVEAAKAGNLPAPKESPDRSQMSISSDSISYTGDAKEAVLAIPGSFVLNGQAHMVATVTRKKEVLPQIVDDKVEIHGTSATVRFLLEGADLNSLRTSHIEGPITMHLVRDTITAGSPDPQTVVDLTADRLDLDFTGDTHTITLTGNVTVNGVAGVYAGYTRASKAVLTFGAKGDIQRIEMTGNPTESQIKPRPASGGGGR